MLLAAAGSLYTDGLSLVLNPLTILLIAAGTLLGIMFGAMPGLTANMGVALLVPVTYSMSVTQAIALLIGIYLGALYGGGIPSILMNLPGTPADMMTGIDGYPMTKRGEGGKALGVSTTSSFLGGIGGALVLAVMAPVIASVAGSFRSQEYFAIALLGLTVISYIAGKSLIKGLASGLLGLFIGTIGIDLVSGYPRFTFGQADLLSGAEFVAVVIGVFGVAELLEQVGKARHGKAVIPQKLDRVLPSWSLLNRLKWVIVRSSVTGVVVGAVPGAGATIAGVVSYGQQTRLSKHPERMGTGEPEGVAACEASNNACAGGAMTTMLSLGIPGDSVTAILIGALTLHGVTAGPLLFEEDPSLVSAIFLSLVVANVFLLVFGLAAAKRFAQVVNLPRHILIPVVIVLAVVGTYALRATSFNVFMMLAFGVLGLVMVAFRVPKAPLVLGLILGPLMETNLRRSLTLNDGDLGATVQSFASSPLCLAIFAIAVLLLAAPALQRATGRRPAVVYKEEE
ncbi:tripartite tricarboxylate transporter permease [Pseudonocardia kunmingensis]|uniref:Putative tricarboxylic transport membrane protein n=1 Tax=Pseudonocardia kunmingensis TaxID=630975 RepID=A0A543DVE9_9PSEU|nr:tripartite tricarboxylate transporter permease [Pseudonocardia kunmingensis]TQM13300.1 putative tricarboxylic transport membrane protein [Pseudonocardia kunmingensis]